MAGLHLIISTQLSFLKVGPSLETEWHEFVSVYVGRKGGFRVGVRELHSGMYHICKAHIEYVCTELARHVMCCTPYMHVMTV